MVPTVVIVLGRGLASRRAQTQRSSSAQGARERGMPGIELARIQRAGEACDTTLGMLVLATKKYHYPKQHINILYPGAGVP
jgi:hypothetical protein